MSNQSFKVKSGLTLTPVDLTTLLNPQAGDLACDINDSNKIKRYDAATSAWAEVGSGGVGSLDILFAQDFESASLSSFTQTGLALDTAAPLHGKVSAKLTHQAGVSPTNDQSFKQVVAVDRKFRGQAIVMRLNIKSSASAGNVTISVYDETNAASLLSSTQLQLSNDVDGVSNAVSFTIPSTSSSISYTITALPETGSPVTFIDDIVAELSNVALLETSVTVPNITAWQGYTPTFQGFGTSPTGPTNIEFEWRQVGENIEIRGKFTSGASTAVEARVGLPAGLTSAGTNIIPSIQLTGDAVRNIASASIFRQTVLIEPSVSYITFGTQTSAINALTKLQGSSFINSGESLSFTASVPCAGLSATSDKTIALTQSGLVQEADSTLRMSNATVSGNVISFSNTIESIGSDVSYSSGLFTIQQSGVYSIGAIITMSGTDNRLHITKNSTTTSNADAAVLSWGATQNTAGYDAKAFWTGPLVSGDIVRFTTANTPTAANSQQKMFITRQGSLKQVAINTNSRITIPTSELRFEGASSRGSTATAIVRFDTMAKLRGDAFTVESDSVLGTRITMTKAGKLDIGVQLFCPSAGDTVSITLNQSVLTSVPSTASEIIARQGAGTNSGPNGCSANINVSVGDIIRIACSSNPSSSAANNLRLSFQEQDISVSVTNTLPQFSESDSSIRLNTANGYGSTASNKIRRFSSVAENLGSDISYVDDSANGATFTVLESGIYNITYSDNFSASSRFGISKNASSLTSALEILASSQILCIEVTAGTNQDSSVSWSGYLTEGDIIRPHTDGVTSGVVARTNFTISKVGKPNVTGVDVTPFVNVPQPETEVIESLNGTSTFGTTNTGVPVFSINKNTNKGIIAVDSTAAAGTSFRALKACRVNISSSANATTIGSFGITKNATTLTTSGLSFPLAIQSVPAGTNGNVSVETQLEAGDIIRIQRDTGGVNSNFTVVLTAEALSDQILTTPETFSTDTAALQYVGSGSYTLSTLQNAPVGTYITFTYAANTNTRTQTATRPTQTDADMNVNGVLLYSRVYASASTAASPAAIAIQIGKGHKGVSRSIYKSAGKTTVGSLDLVTFGSTSQSGPIYKEYDEFSGILLVDFGQTWSTTITSNNIQYSDITSQNSGYLVINASKSPALTGVPLLQPRIATLSDVKASGTAGGTATAGAYQTRTLNTLEDPTGIVTSLASNQFTLPAGEYYIEAFASAYLIYWHKIKIRNITDGTDVIFGSSGYSPIINAGVGATNTSVLSGKITITSSKTFELQHRNSTTQASNGFGVAVNFGDNEIYATVKITKVK